MDFRWSIAESDLLKVALLAERLAIMPLVARCLLNRGLDDFDEAALFLEPRLKNLRDPFALPGMHSAVDRLLRAREHAESVVVFGDYDVDGVTASAILLDALPRLGWQMECYLPDRLAEGYGLSAEAVESCCERFPGRLILAVDCGSTAVEVIRSLSDRGIDSIVLDHHQVCEPPPPAVAIVNPQLDAAGHGQELCSAGLAFKLVHALVKRGRDAGWPEAGGFDLRPLLDLVALGTVADMVPLRGESRILAAAGLERLTNSQRAGLLALKTVSGIDGPVGVYEVGFQLGPRLNASGRLESAMQSLELIRSTDPVRARELALSLDAQNRERQKIEMRIVDEVIGAVRARFDPARDYVIVEGQLLWHVGVVGIVASRVLKEFHRPAVILGGKGEEWRGSGRSIEGFDLAAALRECDGLLVRHGGHAMAAGVSILPENIDPLRERLNGLARAALSPDMLRPKLKLDAGVSLSELDLAALDQLDRLAPFGQGNPAVQVVVGPVSQSRPAQRMGKNRQHAKMWVTDGTAVREAVWWNAPEVLPDGLLELACVPQVNEYNGARNVQLKVLAVRAAGS